MKNNFAAFANMAIKPVGRAIQKPQPQAPAQNQAENNPGFGARQPQNSPPDSGNNSTADNSFKALGYSPLKGSMGNQGKAFGIDPQAMSEAPPARTMQSNAHSGSDSVRMSQLKDPTIFPEVAKAKAELKRLKKEKKTNEHGLKNYEKELFNHNRKILKGVIDSTSFYEKSVKDFFLKHIQLLEEPGLGSISDQILKKKEDKPGLAFALYLGTLKKLEAKPEQQKALEENLGDYFEVREPLTVEDVEEEIRKILDEGGAEGASDRLYLEEGILVVFKSKLCPSPGEDSSSDESTESDEPPSELFLAQFKLLKNQKVKGLTRKLLIKIGKGHGLEALLEAMASEENAIQASASVEEQKEEEVKQNSGNDLQSGANYGNRADNQIPEAQPVIDDQITTLIQKSQLEASLKDAMAEACKAGFKDWKAVLAALKIEDTLAFSELICHIHEKWPLNSNVIDSILKSFKKIAPGLRTFVQEIIEEIDADTPSVKIIQKNLDKIFKSSDSSAGILGKSIIALMKIKFPDQKWTKPQTPEEKREGDLIRIKQVLPLMERDPYEVVDYCTIIKDFDVKEEVKSQARLLREDKPLDGHSMIVILFDYIKRRQAFTELVNDLLMADPTLPLTEIVLFMYLYKHSDDQLKNLLVLVCSKYMALPLVTWDFWDEPVRLVVVREIMVAFDKSMSLLQLKKGSIQGATTFLNDLFGKSFKTHTQTLVDRGTVQIQFDLNSSLSEYVVVADYHGDMDPEIAKKLAMLFDSVLLHGLASEEATVEKEALELKSANPSIKVVLLLQDSDQEHPKMGKSKEEELPRLLLKPFKDLMDDAKTMVKTHMYDQLTSFFNIPLSEFQKNWSRRIDTKDLFKRFLEKIQFKPKELDTEKTVIRQARELMQMIVKQQDFRSTNFLPMLKYVQDKTTIQQKLVSETRPDKLTELKAQLNSVKQKIEECRPMLISKKFGQLIEKETLLAIAPFLANLLRDHLEDLVKPLEQQRNEIQDELQRQKDNPQRQEELQAESRDKYLEIIRKRFSLELLGREIYFHACQPSSEETIKEQQVSFSRQQILLGQPVELIDGDNLIFLSNVSQAMESIEHSGEDLLVVSVIGPQSAGKSLLMNFLFGACFLSSAGRCTKGIYMSIFRFFDRAKSRYRNILVLDSEGIQSAEARDNMFDKRIVYFVMCVSHVVLICNKSEMNAQMTEVVKLVTDSIMNTKEVIMKNPSIFIIMNMMPEVKQNTAQECFNALERNFSSDRSELELQNVLNLSYENIFPMMQAFAKQPFGPSDLKKEVNKPSQAFADQIIPLRRRILAKFNDIESGHTSRFDLFKWVKFAENLWAFSGSYKGLLEYDTLHQKRSDVKLETKVLELFKEHYTPKIGEEIEEKYNEVIAEETHKFTALNEAMRNKIGTIYNAIVDQVREAFKKFIEAGKFTGEFVVKRRGQINQNSERERQRALQRYQTKITKFLLDKSTKVGNKSLNDLASELLRKQNQYSMEEANEKFKEAWEKTAGEIKAVMKEPINVQTDTTNFVCIEFDTKSQHSQHESKSQNAREFLIKLDELGYTEFMQWFEGEYLQKGALFFQSSQAKDCEGVMHYDPSTKHFVTSFPGDLFIVKRICTRYDIAKVLEQIELVLVEEGQLVSKLAQDVTESFNKSFATKNDSDSPIVSATVEEEALNDILDNLNQELKRVEIELTLRAKDLERLIPNDIRDTHPTYNKKALKNPGKFTKISLEDLEKKVQRQLIKTILDPLNYKHVEQEEVGELQYVKYLLPTAEIISDSKTVEKYNAGDEVVNLISEYNKAFPNGAKKADIIYQFIYAQSEPQEVVTQEMQDEVSRFAQFIDWAKLFDGINKLILKTLRKDCSEEGDLAQLMTDLQSEDETTSSKAVDLLTAFDSRVTVDLVAGLESLIESIDKELRCFCIAANNTLYSNLTHMVKAIVIRIVRDIEIYNQEKPLKQFTASIEREKKLFVAKLACNNKEADIALAKKLTAEIVRRARNIGEEETKKEFEKSLQGKKQFFKTQNLQEEYEDKVLQVEKEVNAAVNPRAKTEKDEDLIKAAVSFYVDPKSFVETLFESEFKTHADPLLKSCQRNYEIFTQKIIKNALAFFSSFKTEIENAKATKTALDLFEMCKGVPGDSEKYCQAQAKYVTMIASKTWRKGALIRLPCGDELKEQAQVTLPERVNEALDKECERAIDAVIVDKEQIANIFNFLSELVSLLESAEKQAVEKTLKDEDMLGNMKQEFKAGYTGCSEKCPFCLKQCQEEHDPNDDPGSYYHICRSGHQLRAFAGIKNQMNSAVVQCCLNMAEDQELEINGNTKNYAQHKADFPQWKFEADDEQVEEDQIDRTYKLWNFIGPDLCAAFNKAGNPIQFQKAMKKALFDKTNSTHYIWVVDESCLHTLDDFKDNLRKFLKELTSKIQGGADFKMTLFSFSSNTHKHWDKVVIDHNLVRDIKQRFADYRETYDKVFDETFKAFNDSKDEFKQTVVYFLSDDDATFDESKITQFTTVPDVNDKLRFFGVASGEEHMPTLEKMCAKMPNGDFRRVQTKKEMKDSMLRLLY